MLREEGIWGSILESKELAKKLISIDKSAEEERSTTIKDVVEQLKCKNDKNSAAECVMVILNSVDVNIQSEMEAELHKIIPEFECSLFV